MERKTSYWMEIALGFVFVLGMAIATPSQDLVSQEAVQEMVDLYEGQIKDLGYQLEIKNNLLVAKNRHIEDQRNHAELQKQYIDTLLKSLGSDLTLKGKIWWGTRNLGFPIFTAYKSAVCGD